MNMCARRQPKRKVQNKGGGGGVRAKGAGLRLQDDRDE